MAVASVDAVERSVHKTNEWLADLCRELGTEDREAAWRVLRAYLHVLRDRLTVEESAQLAAQLTHMLRGVFYEGFNPDHQPQKIRERDVFLGRISELVQLDDIAAAERAATATTQVLQHHLAAGEIDEVMSQLPPEIRAALTPHSRALR